MSSPRRMAEHKRLRASLMEAQKRRPPMMREQLIAAAVKLRK